MIISYVLVRPNIEAKFENLKKKVIDYPHSGTGVI